MIPLHKTSKEEAEMLEHFSNRGDFVRPGDNQCLEIFLVISVCAHVCVTGI